LVLGNSNSPSFSSSTTGNRHKSGGRSASSAMASLSNLGTISKSHMGFSSSESNNSPHNSNTALAPQHVIPLSQNTPIPAMRWSRLTRYGGKTAPKALRAHTMNLVGDKIFIIGGCDAKSCYNDLWIFDSETMYWIKGKASAASGSESSYSLSSTIALGSGSPQTDRTRGQTNSSSGGNILGSTAGNTSIAGPSKSQIPDPCRAHSAVLVDKRLFVFGGKKSLTFIIL